MTELYKTDADDRITIAKPGNPWARLGEIAIRLGVAPYQGGTATLIVTGHDGNTYDVWDVVNALLDRMDAHDHR